MEIQKQIYKTIQLKCNIISNVIRCENIIYVCRLSIFFKSNPVKFYLCSTFQHRAVLALYEL